MPNHYLSTVRKWVSVEPTLFFLQFSAAIINALMSSELFRKVKELYRDEIPFGASDKDADDIYKRHLITWNIILHACATMPTFVTGIWAGAFSQKVGRKPFLLIGAASTAINALGYLLTLSNDINAPLWVLLITSSIAGITGNTTVAGLAGFSYIGDTTEDKNMLPVRLVAANAAMSFASMVGGFVEAAMSDLPSAWTCAFSVACAVIGFFWALFLVPDVVPPKAPAETTVKLASSEENCCKKVGGGFVTFWKDVSSVFIAVGRKREGNKRAILICLCLTCFLVNAVIDDEDSIIGTYLVGEPFRWGKEKFGLFSGIKSGVKATGSLLIAYVLKRYLKLDDAILIAIGITSCIAQAAFFGTAQVDWLFYAGAVAGCCRLQVLSGVIAFADTIIERHEIGQIYTLIAMISGFSYFLAIFALLPLYEATFRTLPWLIWAIMIVLCIFGILIILITSFLWKRDVKRTKSAENNKNIYTIESP